LIGSVLGNYRIVQKLGQGGVGDVWKAVDLTLDREVALKVLRPELAAAPEVVARFRTEALALARLNHPNVATIHGFHTEDGTPFIVMEYIAGQTLDALVRGFGPMRSARALPIFFQVLEAMQHAHDHGLVHRDLKASNVMLSALGVVKMLDFGIARIAGSAHLTKGTHSIGTPAWMAPEQIRGEEADARTDVYALGLLLYWIVTARLPFEGMSHYELQRAHVEQAPPSPKQFAPDLPEPVEKVILRALAKRREERFASVAELRAALGEGFVPSVTAPLGLSTLEETIAYEKPPGPTVVMPRYDEDERAAAARRRRIAAGAALVAIAVAAVAAFLRDDGAGGNERRPDAAVTQSAPAPAPAASADPPAHAVVEMPAAAERVAGDPADAGQPPAAPAPRATASERKAAQKAARSESSSRSPAEKPAEGQDGSGWVIRRQ
jgi:serine/threonine-protein kinase